MRIARLPFFAVQPIFTLAIGAVSVNAYAQTQLASTVQTLEFKQGERELDVKIGTLKQRREDRASEAAIGISYAATSYWYTKLSVEYGREEGNGTQFDALEWQNRFRLTDPGRFPLDIGWLAELEWAKDRRDGYQVRFGPLFQKEIGAVQLNLNLFFARRFQDEANRPTDLVYQWQAKYDWKDNLQFGLQGFGELGEWDDWAPRSEQSHRMGPALFGKIDLGDRQALEYNAALLADLSASTRSNGFRMQVKYGF